MDILLAFSDKNSDDAIMPIKTVVLDNGERHHCFPGEVVYGITENFYPEEILHWGL